MIIRNTSNGRTLASNAWLCKSFFENCKGLMFKRISEADACVLTNDGRDALSASIHMMFVPQDLHVIWLDSDMRVVTVKKCRRITLNPLTWRCYAPDKPAKYVIEVLDAKGTLKGDKISFIK